jgi:ribosome-binding protein aMBF1 (putative translation factor)
MAKKLNDLDQLEVKLRENPAFVAEYRQTKVFSDIAMQIIKARNDAGLTQKQLAGLVETGQSAIARIESFAYEGVSLKTLCRIAEALGLEVDITFK